VSDIGLSPVDAAVIALTDIAAWFGYRAGFVATVCSLASWSSRSPPRCVRGTGDDLRRDTCEAAKDARRDDRVSS